MRKPLRIILAGIILAAGYLGTESCSHSGKTLANDDPRPAMPVAVARVARCNLSRDMELAAEFRPYQEIDVHAKVAGYLKEIRVDVGDHVKMGEILAILEIPELAQELEQASAVKSRSMAEVTRYQRELERAQSEHDASHLSYGRLDAVIKSKPGLVAQQECDDALARDRISEAQVAAAEAALAGAQDQVRVSRASEERVKTLLAYSRIAAPFPGVITRRYADTGAMIQAGTASQTQAMPVARLSQIDRLRLVLPVPESMVPIIHTGAAISVRVPALGKTLMGHVSRYSGKVEAATRTMETEVDVANPNLQLVPGMYAYATLTVDRSDNVLAVPLEAIAGEGSKATVLVVDPDNRVRERSVRLGIETSAKAEIVSGLKENEFVIVGSRSQLKADQIVTPKIADPGNSKGD